MPLQDTDNLIIGRGTDSYKITYKDFKDDLSIVSGNINKPVVLSPQDGAGSGDARNLKSDTITAVESGGIKTCETDAIQTVSTEALETSYTFRVISNKSAADLKWSDGTNNQTVNVGTSPTGQSGSWYLCKFTTAQRVSFKHLGSGFTLGFWRSEDGVNWEYDSQKTLTSENQDGVHITSGVATYWAFGRYFNTQDPSDSSEVANNGTYALSAWYVQTKEQDIILTFPSSDGFDCFEPGDAVQSEVVTTGEARTSHIDGLSDPVTPLDWNDFSKLVPNGQKTNYQSLHRLTDVGFQSHNINLIKTDSPQKTISFNLYSGGSWVGNSATYYGWVSDDGTTWTQVTSGTLPMDIGDGQNHQYFAVTRSNMGDSPDEYYAWFYDVNAQVKVISTDVAANTITVDGGDWEGSDGSGTPGGDTTLVKEIPYDTKLTVAGSTDLADMSGSVFSTDGTGAPGPYSQTPYKLVTSQITNVSSDEVNVTLTGITGALNRGVISGGDSSVLPADILTNPVELNKALVDLSYNTPPGEKITTYGGTATAGFLTQASTTGVDVTFTFTYTNGPGVITVGIGATSTGTVTSSGDIESKTHTIDGSIYDEPEFKVTQTSGTFTLTLSHPPGKFIDFFHCGFAETSPKLTFASPNPDLKYFKPGDVVQKIGSAPELNKAWLANNGNNTGTLEFNPAPQTQEGKVWVYFDNYNSVNENWTIQGSAGTKNFAHGDWFTQDGLAASTTRNAGWYYYPYNGTVSSITCKQNNANRGAWMAQGISFKSASFADFLIGKTITPLPVFTGAVAGTGSETFTVTTEQGITVKMICDEMDGREDYGPHHMFGLSATGTPKSESIKVISTDVAANTMTVDGGTWNNGDTVEYQTNGGQGDIVSVNTNDNTITLTNTGDRNNRWIADNKAGTDFAVAGPSIVDDPLLTADVELKSSLFATTPGGADTLKNIVWELNGAEQNAGTSNPYKPTGLALNTKYTVRVKHQGNSLEDSEWSESTTFTTGATRNLYTYYREQVEALKTRITALEADNTSNSGGGSYGY